MTKTRNVQDDMHIIVATPDDYRRATKDLKTAVMQFFSYVLGKDEKGLVMRGWSSGVNPEAIKKDLLQRGAKTTEVHAMPT